MAVCHAWAEHRRVLVEAIGGAELWRPALVASPGPGREGMRSSHLLMRSSHAGEGGGGTPEAESLASLAPGVGSRETNPGHRRRGSVDGDQWVAHHPYVYA